MYKNKKILAIIPARGGSKGLIDKNIKPLLQKPLISFSIEAAQASKYIDKIFVSTDSEKIADIAKNLGVIVDNLRPEHLAQDQSLLQECIIYTINQLKNQGKKFDYFIILQPTSPLRTAEDIDNAIKMLMDENLVSVVSVCEAEHAIELYNKLPSNGSLNNFIKNIKNRQEYEKYYRINGAIYICDCEFYIKNPNYYNENSKAYIMPKERSVDIDDAFDFAVAEAILNLSKTRD